MKAAMERMKNSEERDGAIKDQYAQMTATIRADADKKVAELREQIAQIKQERAESVAEAKVLRDDAQRLNLEKGQLSTQLMTAEANLERVRSEKKDRAEQYRDLSSRFDKLAAISVTWITNMSVSMMTKFPYGHSSMRLVSRFANTRKRNERTS